MCLEMPYIVLTLSLGFRSPQGLKSTCRNLRCTLSGDKLSQVCKSGEMTNWEKEEVYSETYVSQVL